MNKSIKTHSMSWNQRVSGIPTLGEERLRIIDEGDRWTVWFIPLDQPELCRGLADFDSEQEAIEYVKAL